MHLRGYYAILDMVAGETPGQSRPDSSGAAAAVALERAARLLASGPCMLQIRAKRATAAQLAAWGRLILPVARAAGVPLCINDRLDVALAIGAQAVHLGQDDLALADARSLVAGRLAIGISTHTSAQAQAAMAGGADYIGFGPVFPTTTKTNPDAVVGVAALQALVGTAYKPVVAIGGITLENVGQVAAAGAATAALIGAIETARDPVGAGRLVNAAFGVVPQLRAP